MSLILSLLRTLSLGPGSLWPVCASAGGLKTLPPIVSTENEDTLVSTTSDTLDAPGWTAMAAVELSDGRVTLRVTEDRQCTQRTFQTVDRTIRTVRKVHDPATVWRDWALGISGLAAGTVLLGATAVSPQGFSTGEGADEELTSDTFLLVGGGLAGVAGLRFTLGALGPSLTAFDSVEHLGPVNIVTREIVEVCETRTPVAAAVSFGPALQGSLDAAGVWSFAVGELSAAQLQGLGDHGRSLLVSDTPWTTAAPRPPRTITLDERLVRAAIEEQQRRQVAAFTPAQRACNDLLQRALGPEGIDQFNAMRDPYNAEGRPAVWYLTQSCWKKALSASQGLWSSLCSDKWEDQWVLELPERLVSDRNALERVVGTVSLQRMQAWNGSEFNLAKLDVLCAPR